MSVVTRGIKNAFRNSVRTLSIVIILALSIGLSLTMLVARQAVHTKIAAVKSSIGNTINISPAGARGFEGGGNPLTADQIKPVEALPHVAAMVETLQDRLTSDNTNLQSAIDAGRLGRRFNSNGGPFGGGNFTPPITLIGTTNITATAALAQGGGTPKITSGVGFDPSVDADVAIVGTALATKNNLTVGSTFSAYGSTVKVVALYDAGNTFSNSSLLMPLATVQRLSGQEGDITSATVQVDSVANLSSTASDISFQLGSAADVVSSQDTATVAIAPLENVESISVFSLVGALVAGGVIILLTMLMIVRERRREIGVLKAIGASNIKVMAQFVYESITLTVMGAVVGLGIGALAAGPVTRMLVSNSTGSSMVGTAGRVARGGGFGGAGRGLARGFGSAGASLRDIHAAVGWSLLLWGLAAAVVIAIIGSAIPALMISKIRPAEVMRAE